MTGGRGYELSLCGPVGSAALCQRRHALPKAVLALAILVLVSPVPIPATPRGTLFFFDRVEKASSLRTISGTVTYAGKQAGAIVIVASPGEPGTDGSRVSIPLPGSYVIANDLYDGDYWVSAFRDSNGNGVRDGSETYGEYPANPVHLGSSQTGVDIALLDPDVDGDALADWWELSQFGDMTQSGAMDSDGDGVLNADEYASGTDANCADSDGDGVSDSDDTDPAGTTDTDLDGLPDEWEQAWFGDLEQDGSGDPDHDGLLNRAEYLLGTDPTRSNVCADSAEVHLVIYTP